MAVRHEYEFIEKTLAVSFIQKLIRHVLPGGFGSFKNCKRISEHFL